jgi:hypothetical protein
MEEGLMRVHRGILTAVPLALALALALGVGSAAADTLEVYDNFWVQMGPDGQVVGGGGTGYNPTGGEGVWYEYPASGWWNQWFYDHPFSWERWKVICVCFTVAPYDPAVGGPGASPLPEPYTIEVAINWSTPLWSGEEEGGTTTAPPLPEPGWTLDDELLYIERETVLQYTGTEPYEFMLCEFIIPDYNPEWVSIDIRGTNFQIMDGVIWHACVIPEPATMSLLGIGIAALAVTRIRRRA